VVSRGGIEMNVLIKLLGWILNFPYGISGKGVKNVE